MLICTMVNSTTKCRNKGQLGLVGMIIAFSGTEYWARWNCDLLMVLNGPIWAYTDATLISALHTMFWLSLNPCDLSVVAQQMTSLICLPNIFRLHSMSKSSHIYRLPRTRDSWLPALKAMTMSSRPLKALGGSSGNHKGICPISYGSFDEPRSCVLTTHVVLQT